MNPTSGSEVSAGSVQISGTATASTEVTLSVDSIPAVQTTADQSNTFSALVSLDAGDHTIDIFSDSPCGSQAGNPISLHATKVMPPLPSSGPSSPTPSVKTVGSLGVPGADKGSPLPAQNEPLRLIIRAPQNGYQTKATSVYVTGTVSAAATVHIYINDREVGRSLLSSTSFGLSTPLELGVNTIAVKAVTTSGDQTSATLYVTRLAAPGQAGQQSNKTNHAWWRTPAGIATIGTVTLGVVGLAVWLRR